jgi:AcrR family transcriptional regulator
VAEQAGVSIGSLYQYFPNKEAIVAALIAHQASAFRAAVLDAIDRAHGISLAQAIRLITRAIVAQHAEHPALQRALEYEEHRLPVSDDQQALVADTHRHLRRFLRRYRGELAVRDLHDATTTVQTIMRALVDGTLERGQFDPHAVEERVTRAVLGYLCFRTKEG